MSRLTERESKLLLQVFELEAKNARMIADHWDAKSEEDVDPDADLSYEKGYATGRATAAEAAAATLRESVDG